VSERYKHIQKIWRKLDANQKQTYVNKSRQNRYKKKNDDKIANGGGGPTVRINTLKSNSTGPNNLKSPTNSDKQSSDIENFNSRSTTPFVSLEENSENNLAHQQQRQFNIANSVNPPSSATNNNDKPKTDLAPLAPPPPSAVLISPQQQQQQQLQKQNPNQILIYQLNQGDKDQNQKTNLNYGNGSSVEFISINSNIENGGGNMNENKNFQQQQNPNQHVIYEHQVAFLNTTNNANASSHLNNNSNNNVTSNENHQANSFITLPHQSFQISNFDRAETIQHHVLPPSNASSQESKIDFQAKKKIYFIFDILYLSY
jgi:hypothetical protein